MKKKYNLASFCLSRRSLKVLFCMKLIFLCTFICCLQVSAKVYSQDTKIDLSLENVSIAKALKAISQKSDYHFLYNNDLLPQQFRISVNATKKTVPELLSNMLPQAGLTW